MTGKLPPRMTRLVKMLAKCLVLGLLGFVLLLFFFQHRMIWFPRPYAPSYKAGLPKGTVELNYTTGEGKQVAFYLPPTDATADAPERLWVLFCGNGSRALGWMDLIGRDPDKRDGFLLVDYPGYGLCEGSAEPATIAESAAKALATLAEHLHTTVAALDPKLNILAHSIGDGAGLEFATLHPVQRIILVSPFTSLYDMARRTIGWPLCLLLRHNFDNRARLAELAARPQPPRVIIFHGTEDTLIPMSMGRDLANSFPEIATFHEIPGADHNSIIDDAEQQILATMNASEK